METNPIDFKVTAMLCDSAQSVGGKLYILGGGWDQTIAGAPAPCAIAFIVSIPWTEANKRHRLQLELVTSSGEPFLVEGRPIVIGTQLEVGRPPGVAPGSPLTSSFAVTIGPLPYAPNERYEWRFRINDATHDSWSLPFSAVAPPAAPPEPPPVVYRPKI